MILLEEKYIASVKMNEMKNIEIDRLKENIQTSTSVMEATGSESNINLKSKDELGVTVADTEAEIRAKKKSSQEDPTILSLSAQNQLLEANTARMSQELEDKKRMLDVVDQHKESQNTLEDDKQTNSTELTIEKAKKELGRASWPLLCLGLDIDRTVETQIYEECRGDDDSAMGRVLRHCFDTYEPSWEGLAIALMSLSPYKKKGAYIYNKYVNPETFTAEKISEELSFIEDWFQVGYPFVGNSKTIREIVENVPAEAKRVKVFEHWLRQYDEPSWEELAEGIEACFPEWEHKAEKMRNAYLPKVKLKHLQGQEMAPLEDLNSKSAFVETKDVSDWYALGRFLGIPEDKLFEVEEKHERTNDRRQAVLDIWLKGAEETVNWRVLGKTISRMRQHNWLSSKIMQRSQKMKGILFNQKVELKKNLCMKEEKEEEERALKEADAKFTTQLAKKAEELTERVEGLKEFVGAIKITIGKLSTTGTDQEKIHNSQCSLDELKANLDGLNSIFSLGQADS